MEQVDRTTIHHGRRFDFELVRSRLADGTIVEREIVRHPGAVVILGLLDQGDNRQVVMIRNARPAIGDVLLELPAGTIEPGEEPSVCASRELAEESGFQASRLEPLGWFYTTPGLTDERMYAFVGTGLTHVGQDLDEGEQIEVQTVPVSQALAMIDSGQLRDAKSMLTLVLARDRGFLDGLIGGL